MSVADRICEIADSKDSTSKERFLVKAFRVMRKVGISFHPFQVTAESDIDEAFEKEMKE